MTISPKQAWAIAHLVAELRPEWQPEGVVSALKRIADRDPFVTALACIRAAQDKDAKTPGVIPTAGTHWSEGIKHTVEAARPPRREEECPIHAGNWRDSCHGCAADKLAGDNTTPPNLRRPDASNHLARLRAELASTKARLCGHGIDRARGRCADCEKPDPTPRTTETEEQA